MWWCDCLFQLSEIVWMWSWSSQLQYAHKIIPCNVFRLFQNFVGSLPYCIWKILLDFKHWHLIYCDNPQRQCFWNDWFDYELIPKFKKTTKKIKPNIKRWIFKNLTWKTKLGHQLFWSAVQNSLQSLVFFPLILKLVNNSFGKRSGDFR